ncbi:hypothetical protein V5H98_07400 [Georgenia sp. M64]|uniref:hypothetical protein n=1 Tax=Georgenia sp. M64 TaxID=3120520 RepID=UPI0030E2737E
MREMGRLSPDAVKALVSSQIEQYEQLAGRIYGLSSTWTGFRYLGGFERTGTETHGRTIRRDWSCTLGHIDGPYHLGAANNGAGTQPYVSIITTTEPGQSLAWHLARSLRIAPGPPRPELLGTDQEAAPVTIPVDGTDVTFTVLTRDHYFAAKVEVGEMRIVAIGAGMTLADIGLERVDDLTAYIDGFKHIARENGLEL